jgi:hypothetical protein
MTHGEMDPTEAHRKINRKIFPTVLSRNYRHAQTNGRDASWPFAAPFVKPQGRATKRLSQKRVFTHQPEARVLKLRCFSREAASADSCGRQPAESVPPKNIKPRSGDSNVLRRLLSPLRGFKDSIRACFPWAYAHGYLLSPLRG